MQLFHAELRAAVGQGDRCALCQLVAEADRSHMRSFLREHGSDPLVLEPIYAAWGFCAWHTWALALMEDSERGGVLAMALLADDLMRHLASIAATSERAPITPLPIPPSPGPDTTCEMCQTMREEERYWVKQLTDARENLTSDLAESPRFCAPHLRLLTEAQSARPLAIGRWRMLLHSVFTRRAPQQAHGEISLLPLEENNGTAYQAVAGACGVRELTSRFSQVGDALAPLDDAPSRRSDSNAVTCVVCAAEIAAAKAACQRLLAELGATGAWEGATLGLCHGHRWLLADMATAGGNVAGTQTGAPDRLTSSFAAQSQCVICLACWDAASETLRAGTRGASVEEPDSTSGDLCLAHWGAAEQFLGDRGCEGKRLNVRQVQRLRLETAREDLRRYLDYFSVSTRDPDAPPPSTFAWRQAVTLLAGMCPQGQCRAHGNQ